ncbi:50S ribosomal protein L21 [Desmospora sp. 8437]|nr:50S ribosomal protein L21 [Desmospora sp. 8437]
MNLAEPWLTQGRTDPVRPFLKKTPGHPHVDRHGRLFKVHKFRRVSFTSGLAATWFPRFNHSSEPKRLEAL